MDGVDDADGMDSANGARSSAYEATNVNYKDRECNADCIENAVD